jgi:hypothetical protein
MRRAVTRHAATRVTCGDTATRQTVTAGDGDAGATQTRQSDGDLVTVTTVTVTVTGDLRGRTHGDATGVTCDDGDSG